VKRDPIVLIVVAMVVSLMLVFGFNLARRSPVTKEDLAAARMKGQPARDFTLPATDGKPVRLSDFQGKAILLNFWATWCEPCKIEMPWFVELQKQYGPQGLQILGVAMDEDTDASDIASFAKDMGVDYPILVGKQSERDAVANDYGGAPFLPETLVISRDGKVLEKILGLKSRSEIEDDIKKALAQLPVTESPKTVSQTDSAQPGKDKTPTGTRE
jgi:peroxiredoxin